MRELLVVEYTSLDGVVQAPGHPGEDSDGGFRYGGWTGPFMPDHRRYLSQSLPMVGAFLFGRRTYEIFAEYWPTVTDENDAIARALNTRTKYVATTKPLSAGWNRTTVLDGDVPKAVSRLKEESGDPIAVIGSSRLVQTLVEHDLIDRYQLWLHPVILGGGKRLIGDGAPMSELRLVESTTTTSGLVILTYQRTR
jgi:dihydrofolate reductase